MNKYERRALERVKKAQQSHSYWATKISNSFTTQLHSLMMQKGVNQSGLALKTNVSKAYISKVLSGQANFTVESMAKLALALGHKVDDIKLSDISEKKGAGVKDET